jgi:hypothetical protein
MESGAISRVMSNFVFLFFKLYCIPMQSGQNYSCIILKITLNLLQALPPHQNTLLEFVDETVGTNVPKQFIPGVERGFRIMAQKGLYAKVLNYVSFQLLWLG